MKSKCWIITALVAFVLSCSSDPEGPVSARFIDDGTYGIKSGETRRVVIPVNAMTVSVPLGVGTSPFLNLGRQKGIEYRAILLKFDFTLASGDEGKVVSSAVLHLPVQVESPENLRMLVTFNELLSSFGDADSITAIPSYDPRPIADSLGRTVDTLSFESTDFDIDTTVVNGWISGRRPHNGIAILWAAVPDSASSVEMNAHEYGSDPPAVRVNFTDGSSAAFGSIDDYTVVSLERSGLDCVGGVARRVSCSFDPAGIPARAIVHASFLVLRTRGDQGLGATVGEQLILEYSSLFTYYLYAPDSADTLSTDFLEGTGVARSSFDPAVSATVKLPIRAYMADVLAGVRVNTGLVLQSDRESTRVQRASFAAGGAEAPYIEIIYSLPADFGGSR
jgi:hypothetical protein